MDRSLPENHRFRLNEDTYSNNDGKFYVFVKLTDSCMQTIETYLKSNKKSNLSIKSNILFNQHGGDLSIPMNNNERKTYSFQISPEDKTPEVFQCIKQINKDQLESCGLIEQRINIQAQEDVYSMTKKKVTKFQENDDLTKKKTKEIGESSKTILQKKANKTSNSRSSTTVNPISKPQRSTITTATDESVSQKPNNLLSSADRPIRERLIHLLAAKPYKKPELLLRLKNEGIRDEEKEQLDSILSSISTQSRNTEFILQKHFYTNGDVNYDWPYYLKAEALNVRKKVKDLQANANRTNPNKTTTDVRPSSTNLNSKSNTQSNSSVNRPSTTTTTTNPIESSEEINSNSLSDDKIHQLSDMLDKMSSTLQQIEKTQQSSNENNSIGVEDYDQAQREYNLLAPEYNQLIDYLNSVSNKFQSIQQDFHEESTNEKAKKIVEEFLKHENREGFLAKRQRIVELHVKLNHLQTILQKNTSRAFDFQISEDDDDDDDELF